MNAEMQGSAAESFRLKPKKYPKCGNGGEHAATVRQVIHQAIEAVRQVNAAFGAPGELGHGTRKGDALVALYRAHNQLVRIEQEVM